MTRFTRPDNWRDLLAGYALGDLSSDEIARVQQMLSEHPDLIAEVDRLQEALALMPYALPEHDPPAHLRDSLLTAAAAERPLRQLPTDVPEEAGRRSNRWWGWAGLIAAVALLGLGIDNLRLRQVVAERSRSDIAALQQELASSQAIVAALQSPEARLYALEGNQDNRATAAATGSIILNRSQNQVVVVAQNLPQLPDGQAYRLWAMPKNSQQPAYCGQFNSGSSGTVSSIWQTSEASCSMNPGQLLITAELATAPPVPQGKLAMKSRV
jgi:anti-sigma factor RsiW